MDFFQTVSGNNKKVSDLMNEISSYIKRERKKRKLNQTELANLIGVSRDTISKIEGGNQNYNVTTLFKIIKYFNSLGKLSDVFKDENINTDYRVKTLYGLNTSKSKISPTKQIDIKNKKL